MCEFNVGDLVEARKGELVIRDRVVMKSYGLALGAMGWSLRDVRLNGYTLSLVEAATPPLPSEPGVYEAVDEGCGMWVLDTDGSWWLGAAEIIPQLVPEVLVRLESVPDTAKKVLDAVRSRVTLHCHVCAMRLTDIGAEFGVESGAVS